MDLSTIQFELESKRAKVIMPYGAFNFTEDNNFFFAIIPVNGVQWHRDIIPALRKFIRTIPGFEKRRFLSGMCRGRYIDGSVSGIDSYTLEEELNLFNNRQLGKNERLWVIYVAGKFEIIKFK